MSDDNTAEPAGRLAAWRARVATGPWHVAGWALTVLAIGIGALTLLWPVLIAPIAADQRFMYAEAPGQTAGHWTRMFSIPWGDIPERLHQGRFAPLAYIVQWISYTGVTESAISASTSVVTMQALQKIVLLVLSLVAVVVFAASLRGRTADGRLVGLGRRRLLLVGAGVTLVAAVGAQAQKQATNGWVTYAVLTYGAVVVDFLVIAAVLWLTRRWVTRRSVGSAVGTVVLLAVLAAVLNSTYELYYVAVPTTLLAVLIQPVAPAAQRSAALRAKAFVGGTFVALFAAMFTAVHVATSRACSTDCYVGVTPRIDAKIWQTWLYNLGSSLPLSGRSEVVHEARAVDVTTPSAFGSPLVLVVVVAALALVLLRVLVGPPDRLRSRALPSPAARSGLRASGVAALQGAALALCLTLGSAAIMSVSVQAQAMITEYGLPYRHTMVTWVALAVALVLAVVGAELLLGRVVGLASWVVTGVVVAVVGGALLPYNLAATRAANIDPGTFAVTRVYDELVLGDNTGKAADDRRCKVVRQAKKALNGRGPTVVRMLRGAYQEYDNQYSRKYCSYITIK